MIETKNVGRLEAVASAEEEGARSMDWLPDGRALALAGEQAVSLLAAPPVPTATLAITQEIGAAPIQEMAVAPAAERLAVAADDQQIHLYALPGGAPQLDLASPGDPVTALTFSPDGAALAAASINNRLAVWDTAGGQIILDLELDHWLADLSFSPQQDLLAGVDPANFAVRIFELPSGQVQNTLVWEETAAPALTGAKFSPDWQRLAWVARGTVQLMDVGSGSLGPVLEHEDYVNDLNWSPDGRMLVTAAAATLEGSLQPAVLLWDGQTGRQLTALAQPAPVQEVSFSPDGRQIAVLLVNGEVRLLAAPGAP